MNIRRVSAAKFADTITRLHREIFPHDSMVELEGDWWLVFDDETPVGFAGMKASAAWRDASYLSRCGVLKSHRGRGLQRKLLMVRERRARALKVTWLITDTRQNPHSANNLIARNFRMYVPAAPWGFSDALYWKKRIDNQRKP